jgi:hypothetical protein
MGSLGIVGMRHAYKITLQINLEKGSMHDAPYPYYTIQDNIKVTFNNALFLYLVNICVLEFFTFSKNQLMDSFWKSSDESLHGHESDRVYCTHNNKNNKEKRKNAA